VVIDYGEFKMTRMKEYLSHIGYSGDQEVTLENLNKLHSCHLLAVVFENMSGIIGEKVELDPDWILDKIMKRGRGGFCFELNYIFNWLLNSLGYTVRMVSAAVAAPTPTGFSFPTDHLINLVTLNGEEYLCDVGFGKHTFTTPLPLKVGVHHNDHGLHRVVGEKGGAVEIQKLSDGQWGSKCRIDLDSERTIEDFEDQCRYHQEDSHAYMAGNSIAVRYLPNGEMFTCLGQSFRHYKVGKDGEVEVIETKDDIPDPEVSQLLRDKFKLRLEQDIVTKRFDFSPFNI